MPEFDLTINSEIVKNLTLDTNRVSGRLLRSGPVLRIPVRVRTDFEKNRALKIMNASGYLILGQEYLSTTGRPWTHNDRLSVSEPILMPGNDLEFVFPISYETIEGIEKERNGEDFSLTLGIDMVLYREEDTFQGIRQAQCSCNFQMVRSTWQDKMLTDWGYASHFVTSWTAPQRFGEELQAAHQEYKKAEGHFARSNWDSALVDIRNCYDRLISLRKLDLEGEPASFGNRIKAFQKQVLETLLGETRAKMVAAMIQTQIETLSSVTKPGGRAVDRSTAAFALKSASLILAYVSEAMESKL